MPLLAILIGCQDIQTTPPETGSNGFAATPVTVSPRLLPKRTFKQPVPQSQEPWALEVQALKAWVDCAIERGHSLAPVSTRSAETVATIAVAECHSQRQTYKMALNRLGIAEVIPEVQNGLIEKIARDVTQIREQKVTEPSDPRPIAHVADSSF